MDFYDGDASIPGIYQVHFLFGVIFRVLLPGAFGGSDFEYLVFGFRSRVHPLSVAKEVVSAGD